VIGDAATESALQEFLNVFIERQYNKPQYGDKTNLLQCGSCQVALKHECLWLSDGRLLILNVLQSDVFVSVFEMCKCRSCSLYYFSFVTSQRHWSAVWKFIYLTSLLHTHMLKFVDFNLNV